MKNHINPAGAFFAMFHLVLPSAFISCCIRARFCPSRSFLQHCYLCALWATLWWCGVTSAIAQHAPGYNNGYVWARATNWTLNGSSPAVSSKLDDQGASVWNYTYVSGGSLINDAVTNKWWINARTQMTAGDWFGNPVFLSGSKLPYFSQTAAQLYNNDIANAPLAVWTCPLDNAVIEIGGTVAWRGGGGVNTAAVDYVLALRRAADSSWQILDSAVFVPNGGTTPGNIRDYSGAQALVPLSLSQEDQLVWGFKRHANFTSTGSWINMNDSLTFTLGYSTSIAVATGLTAIPLGPSGIDLFWNEPSNLPNGYRVERLKAGGNWTLLSTLPTGTNRYRDIFVEPNTTYSYRITSFSSVASASSSVVQATFTSKVNTLLPAAFAAVRDYGTTWWTGGARGQAVWHVQTSRYAMTFNSGSLSLTSIFPLEERLPETTALVQPQSESFPASAPSSSLTTTLTASGSTVSIQPNATNTKNTQVLNNGKFYQRRWVKIKTNSAPALNTLRSGYEIIAWPDRISIICRVVPTASVTGGKLKMTLNLNSIFDELSSRGVAQALSADDGSGYVVFKSSASGSISVDPSNSSVTIETDAGTWNADQDRSVGLVIYPSNKVAQTLPEADQIESRSLTVTASQTAPTSATLTPSYKLDYGYFEIPLRTNVSGTDSNRIERTRVTLANTTNSPQIARLAFTKGDFPNGAGNSCFLRDMDGNPLGIPVQHSKNWHTSTTDRWIGGWFNALTMLIVPPNATLQFEAYIVGQIMLGYRRSLMPSSVWLVGAARAATTSGMNPPSAPGEKIWFTIRIRHWPVPSVPIHAQFSF